MDPLELALMQMGVPPEQRQAMLQYIMMVQQPPMDPFIGASEFDVDDANDWVDYGRDVNTLMADPMTAASAGMSAYGGANEIGFQAFDPVLEPPKPVAAPDRMLLDRYLARPTDDIGGWIADQIANQGATAFEVVGQLQSILRGSDGQGGSFDDPELEARRTQLASMVPSFTDDFGNTRWDYSGIERLANTLEEQTTAQPEPGAFQDAQGNWWTQEQKDSPMTEWYRKQGLPLPTQEYTLSDFTPEGAAYQAQADALGQGYKAMAPARQAMDKRVEEAYGNYLLAQQAARQGRAQEQIDAATPRALSPNANEYAAFLQGAGQSDSRSPIAQQSGLDQSDIDKMWAAAAERQGISVPPSTGGPLPTPPSLTGAGDVVSFPSARDGGIQAVPLGPRMFEVITENLLARAGGKGIETTKQKEARAEVERLDRTDPYRNKKAMQDYLDAARARSKMGQPAIDAYKTQQRAQGRRFYDSKTGKFEEDRGIAQGNLDYGVARAQGRTPLQDALRARAMAAFLMGG